MNKSSECWGGGLERRTTGFRCRRRHPNTRRPNHSAMMPPDNTRVEELNYEPGPVVLRLDIDIGVDNTFRAFHRI